MQSVSFRMPTPAAPAQACFLGWSRAYGSGFRCPDTASSPNARGSGARLPRALSALPRQRSKERNTSKVHRHCFLAARGGQTTLTTPPRCNAAAIATLPAWVGYLGGTIANSTAQGSAERHARARARKCDAPEGRAASPPSSVHISSLSARRRRWRAASACSCSISVPTAHSITAASNLMLHPSRAAR